MPRPKRPDPGAQLRSQVSLAVLSHDRALGLACAESLADAGWHCRWDSSAEALVRDGESPLAAVVVDAGIGVETVGRAQALLGAAGESPGWIALCPFVTPMRHAAWLEAGASSVLAKPVDAERLEQTVHAVAERYRLTRPLALDAESPSEEAPQAAGGAEVEVAVEDHRVALSLPADRPLRQTLDAVERALLRRAMQEPGVTRAEAARRLGLNRATLYKKAQRHGLDRPDLDRPQPA
ncbi:MAG: helix-turn-helix domain-containing protein [Planctomycetota bacterium]